MRGMWEYSAIKSAWARKESADAAEEKQEGIPGRWLQESPFKEVLEQVKRNAATDCNAQIMRRAYNVGKSCNWESFKEEFRKKKVSSLNGRLRDFLRQGCLGGCPPPEHCAGNFEKEHRLLEKDHTSVWCGVRDLVQCLLSLSLLSA